MPLPQWHDDDCPAPPAAGRGLAGRFRPDPKADAAYLAGHPLPSDKIELRDFKVHGHSVTYEGSGAVAFRVDRHGKLVAFAGRDCRRITVDGQTTTFAESPLPLVTFAPVTAIQRVPGGAVCQASIHGTGTVRIPAAGLPAKVKLFLEGATLGSKGPEVPHQRIEEMLVVRITPAESGRELWIVPAE